MLEIIQGKSISDAVFKQGFNQSLTIYFVDGSRLEIDTSAETCPREPSNLDIKVIHQNGEEKIIDTDRV